MTSARAYRMLMRAGALALLFVCASGPVRAQAAVTSLQPLDFGQILPGLAERVDVSDTWRRAELRIDGSGSFEVKILVPDALVSPDGARIPLTFRNGDGLYVVKTVQPVYFDPNVTQRFRIPPGQKDAMIYMGGTASTTADQRAGRYTATIVLVVTNTGV